MSGKVQLKTSRGIAHLILNNPGKLNAISLSMLEDLIEHSRRIEEDSEIRVVLLQGSEGNFSSGADISDLAGFDKKEALKFHMKMNALSRAMQHSSKIYIALLQGFSLGGGFELSLSADMRICTEDVIMGQPEVNIGLNAGAGGNAILPRFTGKGNAMYLILTGEKFNAAKGLELGIIQKIVPKSRIIQEGEKLAENILSLPEDTVSLTKMAVNASENTSIDSALEMEALIFSWLNGEKEIKEKMKKFLKK